MSFVAPILGISFFVLACVVAARIVFVAGLRAIWNIGP